MQHSLHESVRSVRRICSELRPRMLDNLGLVPALEWLVEGFVDRAGIACDLKIESVVELDDARNSAVFRIVEESLTNVERHARATRVDVHIVRRDDMVAIEVCDDGVGFDMPDSYAFRSYGVPGMRERALALGGTFAISSAPGKGTRVEAKIPVDGPSGA